MQDGSCMTHVARCTWQIMCAKKGKEKEQKLETKQKQEMSRSRSRTRRRSFTDFNPELRFRIWRLGNKILTYDKWGT